METETWKPDLSQHEFTPQKPQGCRSAMGMVLWVVLAAPYCDQNSVPTATCDMRYLSPALCPAFGMLERDEGWGRKDLPFYVGSALNWCLPLVTKEQQQSAGKPKKQILGPNLSLYLKEL